MWAAESEIHPTQRTGLGEREPKQLYSEQTSEAESPRAWGRDHREVLIFKSKPAPPLVFPVSINRNSTEPVLYQQPGKARHLSHPSHPSPAIPAYKYVLIIYSSPSDLHLSQHPLSLELTPRLLWCSLFAFYLLPICSPHSRQYSGNFNQIVF